MTLQHNCDGCGIVATMHDPESDMTPWLELTSLLPFTMASIEQTLPDWDDIDDDEEIEGILLPEIEISSSDFLYHFCSFECLGRWATRKSTEGEVSPID